MSHLGGAKWVISYSGAVRLFNRGSDLTAIFDDFGVCAPRLSSTFCVVMWGLFQSLS